MNPTKRNYRATFILDNRGKEESAEAIIENVEEKKKNVAVAPPVAEKLLAPAITPPGKQLEEAERLKIENLYLKLQNCQLQVQNLDNSKALMILQMKELQAEMEKTRAELSAKYGTDISRTTVKADGTIVSPPAKA